MNDIHRIQAVTTNKCSYQNHSLGKKYTWYLVLTCIGWIKGWNWLKPTFCNSVSWLPMETYWHAHVTRCPGKRYDSTAAGSPAQFWCDMRTSIDGFKSPRDPVAVIMSDIFFRLDREVVRTKEPSPHDPQRAVTMTTPSKVCACLHRIALYLLRPGGMWSVVHIYIYTHTHVYTHAHIHTHTYTHIHIYNENPNTASIRLISQTPQCTSQASRNEHSATEIRTHVRTSAARRCPAGCGTGEPWDSCIKSIHVASTDLQEDNDKY